jgi:transcriptional regulator with XRE-family HTH domain
VLAATLGGIVRETRRSIGLTQIRLAARIGISRARLAEIERGDGVGAPLGMWIALGLALKRPLAVSFTRTTEQRVRDAGHLAIQEMVLAAAERHGWRRHFELPTKPAMPAHSVDVLLRLDAHRLLVIIEIWNRLEDLGAAVRTTHRKQAEAAAHAAAIGSDDRPYDLATCWILRDSAANRELVRSYPAVVRTEFTGSSRGWVDMLTHGTRPPAETGVFWADPGRGFTALHLPRLETRPADAHTSKSPGLRAT